MADWWADVERARELGAVRYQHGDRIIEFASPVHHASKREVTLEEADRREHLRRKRERDLLFAASGTAPAETD